jgi:hypothetical protein
MILIDSNGDGKSKSQPRKQVWQATMEHGAGVHAEVRQAAVAGSSVVSRAWLWESRDLSPVIWVQDIVASPGGKLELPSSFCEESVQGWSAPLLFSVRAHSLTAHGVRKHSLRIYTKTSVNELSVI